MKKRTIEGLLCLTISMILLTGCASKSAATVADLDKNLNTTAETETKESTKYPLVITHALGETVIESKPERIVTLGWENQDTPLALGIVPIGVSAANYGLVTDNMLHTWTDNAFKALGENNPVVFNDVDGFDYEAISDAQPDVILAAYSGMTAEDYQLLSKIAPVVPYQTAAWQTTWREQTILNATGMGMKEEGEAKVAEVDALMKEKLSQYPELAGAKTAFFWISPDDFSTFYAYLPTDPRASFLTDLGLVLPESILSLAEDKGDFSVTLSRENVDSLGDVELMIVYGDEALLASLQADELMSTIPAIKNGAVLLLDSTSALAAATTPSILSIPAEIDDYLRLLNEAYLKNK